nr:unnamed protein product [Callosobruchus chinensis]
MYMHKRSLARHLKFECNQEPKFFCPHEGCDYRAHQKVSLHRHLLIKHCGNARNSIFGALGLQHINTVPKEPPPRPKFKRTSKPTEKLSMLMKEQELKKSKEGSNKMKKSKLWKKAFRFKRDGVPQVSYRCGWCNSTLSEDAEECPDCDSKKTVGHPGTTRRSAKIKKEVESSSKDPVKSTKKTSTPDKRKYVKKVKSSTKKATASTVKNIRGLSKYRSKVEVIEVTKQTGHVIKVYRCSKCSAFLSRDNKKCTKCVQRLKKLLESRQVTSSIKQLTAGAKTKKQITAVKSKRQSLIKKKESPQKSCKLCKKSIRKADEDHCYTCRGHSKYKGVLEVMKARAGERNSEEAAGPSTSGDIVMKSEDTTEPSTTSTSNVLKSMHDNNQGVEVPTGDLPVTEFIEIIDEDDDEEVCYVAFSEVEMFDD